MSSKSITGECFKKDKWSLNTQTRILIQSEEGVGELCKFALWLINLLFAFNTLSAYQPNTSKLNQFSLVQAIGRLYCMMLDEIIKMNINER